MFESEFIVYVEKDKRQRYKCALAKIDPWKEVCVNKKAKVVYFEKFKSSNGAKLRLRKLQTLSRLKLIEMIKDSNPEMLNLIKCI